MSWQVMVDGECGIAIDSVPGGIELWCSEPGVEDRVFIPFDIVQADQLIEALQEALMVAQEMLTAPEDE